MLNYKAAILLVVGATITALITAVAAYKIGVRDGTRLGEQQTIEYAQQATVAQTWPPAVVPTMAWWLDRHKICSAPSDPLIAAMQSATMVKQSIELCLRLGDDGKIAFCQTLDCSGK